jgi:hypothetical protein
VQFNPKAFISVEDYSSIEEAAEAIAAVATNDTRLAEMRAEPVSYDLDGLNAKLRWYENAGAAFAEEAKRLRALLGKYYGHLYTQRHAFFVLHIQKQPASGLAPVRELCSWRTAATTPLVLRADASGTTHHCSPSTRRLARALLATAARATPLVTVSVRHGPVCHTHLLVFERELSAMCASSITASSSTIQPCTVTTMDRERAA